MPKFTYEIKQGQILYDDPSARAKFLSKDDGYRGYESHHKPSTGKSTGQCGYYWGLLVPEITKAIQELGWTVTIGKGKTARERLWKQDKTHSDTHDWLKDNAAQIGGQGEFVTLSEQDMEMCRKFIDNVMWIAEKWFKMNRVNLEAKRPGASNG